MKLQKPKFRPYPTKAIKPKGWLADQLKIQLESLSGNLDTFWPDIQDSAWIGGEAEGWERMPYWLDGVIPLAWLTEDTGFQKRLTGYMDYIIEHQHEDGWLGPRVEDKKEAADVWSQALALKMLVVFHDATGDERVQGCVEKALRKMDRHIDANPLNKWGQFRWFEFLISIYWLYERTEEQWLIDLAVKFQAQGFNWQSFFKNWPLTEPTEKGRWNFAGHVVNNAMAIKESGLCWRLTGEEADRQEPYSMMEQLDRFHGMPTGVFTGDECIAGTSAIQGTELCAVVEYMYSLEILTSILGDAKFADRLEMITFNALPATFTPDMWGHQYDQQLNQVECSTKENRPWNTNSPDANLYGLEPNYGCCTANLSQGWPKFAAHLWMASENGIAAVAYAPSILETAINGTAVSVELETEYPFREELQFTVKTDKPVTFPLQLRIPEWTKEATIEIDGKTAPVKVTDGFHVIDRTWDGETTFALTLPMTVEQVSRPNGAVSILRGPLLYALPIGEEWKQVNQDQPYREKPHADWEVYPTTPWNYALTSPEQINFSEKPLASPVFSPANAPVSGTVAGKKVPEWQEENGSAQLTPASPLKASGETEELTLIPYGCTSLRIGEFPIVK